MAEIREGEYAKLPAVLPFPSALYVRTPVKPQGWSYTFQRSFLPYLSIEFARLGAQRIALHADDPSTREVAQLPPSLAPHVKIVDSGREARERVTAYMAPVFDEVYVDFSLGGLLHRGRKDCDPRAVDAVAAMRNALLQITLGIENRLQIDLDLASTRTQLALLDGFLKSHAARHALAAFIGLLGSYQQEEVDSVCFTSSLEKERVDHFLTLLDDAVYRELSEQCSLLGLEGKIRKAKARIAILVRKLSRKRQKAIVVGTTAVGLATAGKVKLDAAVLQQLLPRGPEFLPPIVSYSRARQEAIRNFREREALVFHPQQMGDQVVSLPPGNFLTDPVEIKEKDLARVLELAKKHLGARPVSPPDSED